MKRFPFFCTNSDTAACCAGCADPDAGGIVEIVDWEEVKKDGIGSVVERD